MADGDAGLGQGARVVLELDDTCFSIHPTFRGHGPGSWLHFGYTSLLKVVFFFL